ncbi:MAG: hypothetical protein Fur0027_22280 [Raineya sp.]
MSIYIDSLKTILSQAPPLNTLIKNAQQYYAHTSPHKTPETLQEHIELVQSYCIALSDAHQLDSVIDRLILNLLQDKKNASKQTILFIKKLFAYTIVFHDYGKINENFQAHPDKMNNPHFKEDPQNPLGSQHSGLGAYLYIVKHIDEIVKNFPQTEQAYLIAFTLGFSYVIFKHHASRLQAKEDIVRKFCFSEKEIPYLQKYIANYRFCIEEKIASTLFMSNPHQQKVNIAIQFEKFSSFTEHAAFYLLVRLAFSLLTASDYLATNQYMTETELQEFGVLSPERIREIYQYVVENDFLDKKQQKVNFNKITYQELHEYGQLKNPKEPNRENLNILRKEMALEVIRNVRKNIDKNLFYIEAPTGGGKTNLSILATIELLNANQKLNKVYYIFPFTTLITQTYQSIIDTIGLKSNEIVQLHSKAEFKSTEESQDGVYGNQKINYLDNLFVNYPFCLLSHIKFFDLLKTNEKESNYLLHRLANAVVIIDELQSYNPSHWDKVIFFIKTYAHLFNVKFILMSATLPKLDKLKVIENQVQDFVYLLPNAKTDYFQNPNFAQRVSFNFELFGRQIDLEDLARFVLEKSSIYAQKDFGEVKPKGSVFSIVEFIFKKSATEFYHLIREQESFFDEIFVLSGTILEHRRKYIINFLKNPENREKKILLITTQVVEAGVDIDMDLGFKNQSLIDSDEQLAGRINRNMNKSECELYLFKINEPSVLYAKDKRYKATKQIKNEYAEILKEKDFDKLYQIVLEDINSWNQSTMAIGFQEYLSYLLSLNFEKTHTKFQLIEQKNLTIFVPLAIPKEAFSEQEIRFLAKAGIETNRENKIEGSIVFDLYIQIVENKKADFITKKINLKILQGILGKFVFSIFDDKKANIRRKLIAFADIEKVQTNNFKKEENDGTTFGFLYLERYQEVYDETFGLDENKFEDVENCIL